MERAATRITSVATRKRPREEAPRRDGSETTAMSTVAEALQTVIQEVRLLREEQARRESEYVATIRRQEEELHRLRGTNSGGFHQLSPLLNSETGDSGDRAAGAGRERGEGARGARQGGADAVSARGTDAYASERVAGACVANTAGRSASASSEGERFARAGECVANACVDAASACVGLGYKLKPDTYDGSAPLHEYFSQLDLIARANCWNDSTKTVALASSLRGKARSVLDSVQDVGRLNFAELKAKLELRFGEGRLSQNCYSALTNRRQKFGEDLAALGSDIERLSRLAYPECPYEIRDKIACSQFVTAVSDHFIRRALQMEGITSLSLAVERAKALKIIQGEGFARERERFVKNSPEIGLNSKTDVEKGETGENPKAKGSWRGSKLSASQKDQKGSWRGSRFSAGRGECWSCGKPGHFRSECPEGRGNAI